MEEKGGSGEDIKKFIIFGREGGVPVCWIGGDEGDALLGCWVENKWGHIGIGGGTMEDWPVPIP
jgi:hypothetical protein